MLVLEEIGTSSIHMLALDIRFVFKSSLIHLISESRRQVPFAEAIKKAYPSGIVGAVGMITEPQQAESYLQEGKADVIFLARELIRNPHWPLRAAKELGVPVKAACQYERAW